MDPSPNPVLDYRGQGGPAADESLPPRRAFDWINIVLQVGHRAVSLAVFVLVVALAGAKTEMFAAYPIARTAFILADIAALCGVGGWYLATVQQKPRREGIGLIIFSVIVAGGSLATMLATRP